MTVTYVYTHRTCSQTATYIYVQYVRVHTHFMNGINLNNNKACCLSQSKWQIRPMLKF